MRISILTLNPWDSRSKCEEYLPKIYFSGFQINDTEFKYGTTKVKKINVGVG